MGKMQLDIENGLYSRQQTTPWTRLSSGSSMHRRNIDKSLKYIEKGHFTVLF